MFTSSWYFIDSWVCPILVSLALLSFEGHWLYLEVIRGEYEMSLMLALICWETCASWSSYLIGKNFKIINLDMLLKKICIGKILTSIKVRPLDLHLNDHFIKDEVKKKRSLRYKMWFFAFQSYGSMLTFEPV